jgi:hypothetical protein
MLGKLDGQLRDLGRGLDHPQRHIDGSSVSHSDVLL